MLICIVYNKKACGMCKTVNESEIKSCNHVAHNIYKTFLSISTDPCCWCGDIDCGVDMTKDESTQLIHVQANAFQFPPMKLSTYKSISIKNPSTNHPIYCSSCKNMHGHVKMNNIVHNFIITCFRYPWKKIKRIT